MKIKSIKCLFLTTLLPLSVSYAGMTHAKGLDNLPKPSESVPAKVGKTYHESTPGTVTIAKAPAGAPNIVIFMIDDIGFGTLSPFGGPIPAPALESTA